MIAASGAAILSTDLYAPPLPHLPVYFGTNAATAHFDGGINFAADAQKWRQNKCSVQLPACPG